MAECDQSALYTCIKLPKNKLILKIKGKKKYLMIFVNTKKLSNRFGLKLVLNLTNSSRYLGGTELELDRPEHWAVRLVRLLLTGQGIHSYFMFRPLEDLYGGLLDMKDGVMVKGLLEMLNRPQRWASCREGVVQKGMAPLNHSLSTRVCKWWHPVLFVSGFWMRFVASHYAQNQDVFHLCNLGYCICGLGLGFF